MVSSITRSTASGSTNVFSVPFPYLDQTHVQVRLNGVLKTLGVDYTFPTSSTISITAGNPTAGTVVERKRVTPTDPLTNFTPGNLDTGDLNASILQPLYLAQEGCDAAADILLRGWFTANFANGGTITVGADSTILIFDALGNVVPGPNAATIQGYATAAAASAAAALASQNAASTSAGNAAGSATAASTSATNAAGSATAASTSAATAAANAAATITYPQGRLTLTSGVAITETDVTGATSVYYTPGIGGIIPIWNGTTFVSTVFSELTLALDPTSGHTGYHQSGKNFDLFVINDSGTIRLVSGPTWTSDTGRGTGAGTTELERKNGVWTNKQTLAAARFGSASGNTVSVTANKATFVGTIRTTADGVVEDSSVKRFVSNAYNLASRQLRRIEPVSSWNYSTATMRQANGNTANKVEVLNCLPGFFTNLVLQFGVQNSTTTPAQCVAGIGLDSTTTRDTTHQVNTVAYAVSTQQFGAIGARYAGNCGIGYHYLSWLEQGAGTADTQTWYSLPAFGLVGDTEG